VTSRYDVGVDIAVLEDDAFNSVIFEVIFKVKCPNFANFCPF